MGVCCFFWVMWFTVVVTHIIIIIGKHYPRIHFYLLTAPTDYPGDFDLYQKYDGEFFGGNLTLVVTMILIFIYNYGTL
jgi:hypothetical protein